MSTFPSQTTCVEEIEMENYVDWSIIIAKEILTWPNVYTQIPCGLGISNSIPSPVISIRVLINK
jgi:hypothetical protein